METRIHDLVAIWNESDIFLLKFYPLIQWRYQQRDMSVIYTSRILLHFELGYVDILIDRLES